MTSYNDLFRIQQGALKRGHRALAFLSAALLSACINNSSATKVETGAQVDFQADLMRSSTQGIAAGKVWKNIALPIAADAKVFKAQFTLRSSSARADAVLGFSEAGLTDQVALSTPSAAANYQKLATSVRFNSVGAVDVRNDAVYSATNYYSYRANISYIVKIDIDLTKHRYQVSIGQAGQVSTVTIAKDFAFRSEQAAVQNLKFLSILSNAAILNISNFTVQALDMPLVPLLACGATPSGTSALRTKFQMASVAFGQTCTSEIQSALCTNGLLSAFTGTFTFDSCVVNPLIIVNPPIVSRIATPTGLSPANGTQVATTNSVHISWNAVSGASGYLVRAERLGAGGAAVEAIPQNNSYQLTSFDLPVIAGNRYRFWVHAYDQNFNTGSGYIPANYSDAAETAFTVAAAPIIPPPPSGACGTIANGATTSRTMFQSASVTTGLSCVSQTQTATCNNGTLSAFSGTYTNASCFVEQPPQPPVAGSSCVNGSATSISQHGITWTFSSSRPCGNYVNGDYWVLGPVTVTTISNPNGSGRDGSMINPIPGDAHGYDERVAWYSSALDVSRSLPVALNAGQSLVSTLSRDPTLAVTSTTARPAILSAAVLTIVSANQSSDKFRPPFTGVAKPVYSANSLQRNLLPTLAPVANTPTLSAMEGIFPGMAIIDHKMEWMGEYLHPYQSMPHYYGGSMSVTYGDGLLRLMLNDPLANKETLLIRLVQIGIDHWGEVNAGAAWGAISGTMGVGRKLPIMFAGLMLNESSMKNIATIADTAWVFQEDGETFYLTQESVDAARAHYGVTDSNNVNPTYYDNLPMGTAVWGERHVSWAADGLNIYSWKQDPGKIAYDGITYGSTEGEALAARRLGLMSAWNHQAFFDWQDRFHQIGHWKGWGSDFAASMWAAYR